MKRQGVSRRLIGLLIAGVALIALYQIGVLAPIVGGLTYVTKPFQGAVSAVGGSTGNWLGVVGSVGQLGDENQQLKAEVAALRQKVSQDTELKAQNDELRRQLGVGSIQPDRLIAAEVIGYQPDNFRQFITIGRGSRDGVKPGMAVVQQGALVGIIQDVGPTTSKVFLIIDPNFRVAALDQDAPGRPSGTIRGQIGNGLILDKVAQTDTIKPGDTIVTSGIGGNIEKGLIIGRIQTVDKQDNGVFQTAQVTSNIQFGRLEIVYVVVRPQ